jgi:hypothetical protein
MHFAVSCQHFDAEKVCGLLDDKLLMSGRHSWFFRAIFRGVIDGLLREGSRKAVTFARRSS